MITTSSNTALSRRFGIVREFEPELPCVACEGSELQQVFLNLIKNGARLWPGRIIWMMPTFVFRLASESEPCGSKSKTTGPAWTRVSGAAFSSLFYHQARGSRDWAWPFRFVFHHHRSASRQYRGAIRTRSVDAFCDPSACFPELSRLITALCSAIAQKLTLRPPASAESEIPRQPFRSRPGQGFLKVWCSAATQNSLASG